MDFAQRARTAVLAVVIGLATLIAPAHALEPDEATDYLQNPARTGSLNGDWLEPPLVHRWTSEELGSPISFPLIARDRVFVTARTGDASFTLFALDRATGEKLWAHPLGSGFELGGPTYSDGRVFVVGGSGTAKAFASESGELLWSRSILPSSHFGSRVPPVVAARRLLVGLADRLTALDVETGATVWAGPADGAGGTPVAAAGDRAYVSDNCGNVMARELGSGTLAWRRRSGFSCGGGTHLAVHAGLVYVGNSEQHTGLVLDADTGDALGATPWSYPPALAGEVGLFVSNGGRHLETRDLATDDLVWELTTETGEAIRFPPVVVGDEVYLARHPRQALGSRPGRRSRRLEHRTRGRADRLLRRWTDRGVRRGSGHAGRTVRYTARGLRSPRSGHVDRGRSR